MSATSAILSARQANSDSGAMYELIRDLYPICRSITGAGVVETLARLQADIPCTIHSVPSGTEVFDWTVPQEWNVRDAYVLDSCGERVIDFRRHSLHLLSYSAPFRGRVSRTELLRHLYSLPEQPDLIPYRTSYYRKTWGFCVTHRQREELRDDAYDVVVDTTLTPGRLHYGECYLPGDSGEEILISTHICHPSMCNDNLSGIAVAAALVQALANRPRQRLGYRFIFVPATIGAIAWLAVNREIVPRIRAGVVLSCVGDSAPFSYKRSRRGDAVADRVFAHLLNRLGHADRIRDFSPYGYDERQYCSPGFNLPVGCLMRSVYGEFPEYHTSADNLDFVRPDNLQETVQLCLEAFDGIQRNATYINLHPWCEPQLGKRNLYGSGPNGAQENLALLWVLNQSDGFADLLTIAERSGMALAELHRAAERLEEGGLLRRCPEAAELPSRNEGC